MHNLIAYILTLKKNVAVVEWVFTINNVGVKLHSKKVAEISILKEVLKISHLINIFSNPIVLLHTFISYW